MLHLMKVHGLTLDPLTNVPIVILMDKEKNRALPIWIGVFEANAILLEMEKIKSPRPMTHDLIINFISKLKGKIQKIIINDLLNDTFYAKIEISLNNSEQIVIDARPSDAIALALRVKAPIFVNDKVLSVSKPIDQEEKNDPAFKEWIEKLKPEDFGNYSV